MTRLALPSPCRCQTMLALLLGIATWFGTPGALAAGPDKKPASVKPKAQTGADLLKLEDGRSGKAGPSGLIATTGIRGFRTPVSQTAHALILAIGDYQAPVPKLKGVAHDVATASEIAARMGVARENIHVVKDGDLTLEGMRRAFDALEARLEGNDQVFVYYSGHGSRQVLRSDAGGESCGESLVTVDGQAFTDLELEERLRRVAQKSLKTIVFLDACHSGGATTRALGAGGEPAFSPKSWVPAGQSCSRPSNVMTRSLMVSKTPGSGGANFVHIAAARDSEVSLDQPSKGGVATQAWLVCLAGSAHDADASGGISAEEIRNCAQQQINQKLQNVTGFAPHHITISGNPNMVLSYASPDASEAATASSASSTAASAPSPPPASNVRPAPAQALPLATLADIYNSRDDRRLVTLAASKSTLKIGKDEIAFSLSSREGGYVYLLMVGTDGQTFDLLFPNTLDRDNLLTAGATLQLPRANWQLSAAGPAGRNTLLAIVTDSPRDFAAAGLKPSGPFSAAAAVAAKDIQLVTAGATGAEDTQAAECARPANGSGSTTRTLAVRKRCSSAYGAALLTIEEVE